ncbi:hypothetical protein [Sorangium sp. So ce1000]|uniref:hypothetical protein n=1 Tax=Sorangium sp. So ce1000 TaxID=3133325 RepID=UPI003F610705
MSRGSRPACPRRRYVVGVFVQFGGEFEDAARAAALEASRKAAKAADPSASLPHSFT